MIGEVLPECVATSESTHDPREIELFPEEEAVVAKAVEKRRREFTTARMWPPGALGSITHCEGYRAAAVARPSEIATLGIDAEPNARLPEGLLGDIARSEELLTLRRLELERPGVHWDRLLFSAKESVYKAWFPLAKSWLGFEDAVIDVDQSAGTFQARLLVEGPYVAGRPLRELSGRWTVQAGIILTAIALASS
jgi:4'-phosphopantetheinyl transferase EntD